MQLIIIQNRKKEKICKTIYKEQTKYNNKYILFIEISTDNEFELFFHDKVLFYHLSN